jgi:metallophosphoesterase (TIGR00282 family)
MRILALGDIVGLKTVDYIKEKLWNFRKDNKIDFVIANGENTNDIFGLGLDEAKTLLECGIDVITTGNHVWGRRDIYEFLDTTENVIRPANYPSGAPGNGYTVVNVDGFKILCINVLGTVFMESLSSPFEAVENILKREEGNYDVAILDVHAEATSEKLAMGYCFDGRITAIFGTHTHVATADERVLKGGSGYITDLGMCGPTSGILGVDSEAVLYRFLTKMPKRYTVAQGDIEVNGAIFDIDPFAGKTLSVKRIKF